MMNNALNRREKGREREGEREVDTVYCGESQISACTVNNLVFDITINSLFTCNWNVTECIINQWNVSIFLESQCAFANDKYHSTTMQNGHYINHHKVINNSFKFEHFNRFNRWIIFHENFWLQQDCSWNWCCKLLTRFGQRTFDSKQCWNCSTIFAKIISTAISSSMLHERTKVLLLSPTLHQSTTPNTYPHNGNGHSIPIIKYVDFFFIFDESTILFSYSMFVWAKWCVCSTM